MPAQCQGMQGDRSNLITHQQAEPHVVVVLSGTQMACLVIYVNNLPPYSVMLLDMQLTA